MHTLPRRAAARLCGALAVSLALLGATTSTATSNAAPSAPDTAPSPTAPASAATSPYGITELLLPRPSTTSTAPGWEVRAPHLLSLVTGDPRPVASAIDRALARAVTPAVAPDRARADSARPGSTRQRDKASSSPRSRRLADRARSGRGEAGERGRRGPKVAYLTFDDGPSEYTPQVLRILSEHDASATFFVLGANAEKRPAALHAIRRQGSAVGNHTWGHPVLSRLPDQGVRRALRIHVRSACFRPPYGATTPRVVRLARAQGLRQVLWTADSRDWEKPGPRAIRREALRDLHPGSIILMHDGGGDRSQTVAALPGLLRTLTSRGYEVRALPYC